VREGSSEGIISSVWVMVCLNTLREVQICQETIDEWVFS
jgi:hypothetical protein